MKKLLLVLATSALSLLGPQTVRAQQEGNKTATELKAQCAAARKAGKASTMECDTARRTARAASASTVTRAEVKAGAVASKTVLTEGGPSGSPAKVAPSATTRAEVKAEAIANPSRGKNAEGNNKR